MKLPERIICLTEETTELFYLLGVQDKIVGVTAYTVRPPQAKKEKPIVSSFISGNLPKIKNLNPDLIIGFSDIQHELASKLIKEGLNVLITNQRSLEEIFQTMYLLGTIVDKRKETEILIQSWKQKLKEIQTRCEKRIQENANQKPKIFFQEWDEPIITGIRWVSELIAICGGEDIFQEKQNSSLAKDRIVSLEDVSARNPDIIIGSWCGKPMDKNWIKTREQWSNIKAVQENAIIEIDSSIILQPGPALFLEGIDQLEKSIWRL